MDTYSIVTAVYLASIISHADAAVVEYGTDQRDQWFRDVGGLSNVSTVDFTGYADFTPVNEQWADLGVHFSGFVVTSGFDDFGYPNDGWGLRGEPDINVTFDEPSYWIAADFPGRTQIDLFMDDQLIYTSTILGGGGTGFFGGLVSEESFNSARFFYEPAHARFLDDLHFGPPIAIPAPSAFAGFALLVAARRQRR